MASSGERDRARILRRVSLPGPRLRRRGLVLVALGALVVLGLYAVGDTATLARDPVLGGLDFVGAAVCHRLTDRSFTIAGRQLPLCARCTGMYLGTLLAIGVPLLAGRARWAAFPRRGVLAALLGLLGLMALDGINSYSHFFPNAPHLYEPQNWLRLVTGMGAGLALGTFTGAALAQTLWQDAHWRPAVESLGELALLASVGAVVVLLVLSNQPALLYVLAIASGAGILLTLGAINTILMVIAFRREGRAATWSGFLLPLTLGIVLAALELSAGAALRQVLFGTLTGLPGL